MNTQNELYENASISLEDEVDLYSESPKVQDETKVIAQYRINGVVCQRWVAGSDDLKELSRQIDLCLERLCRKMEDSGADRDYFNQWTCSVSN